MYRKASWVGITLGTITSFTGIHSIVFYSGLLFEPDFRIKGSAIIWIMNFFASAIGLNLLHCFGRRTLLLTMLAYLIVALVGIWYFADIDQNQTASLVVTCTWIVAFEFSFGPIFWLYVSEVCNDKATSVTTVVFWLQILAFSILTPYMINDWLPDGRTWLLFTFFSFFGLLFIIFVMKETKGKSEEQVKRLY